MWSAFHGNGRGPPNATIYKNLCFPMLSEYQKTTLLAVFCAFAQSRFVRENKDTSRQRGVSHLVPRSFGSARSLYLCRRIASMSGP